MRVEGFEQAAGELGKLVLQLVAHPRSDEGETLHDALDMRVVDRLAGEAEAARDLRMRGGKACRPPAQRRQLVRIALEKTVSHAAAPR
jgi:hypothetical protein